MTPYDKSKAYYVKLLENSDEIEPKYYDYDYQFSTFHKVIDELRKRGMIGGRTSGIDFGCGVSIPVILGKYYKIKITGIDIRDEWRNPHENKRQHAKDGLGSWYGKLQNVLIKDRFDIRLFDTNIRPWSVFGNSSRDFIIASWSINKDFLGGGLDPEDCVANRMEEFIRILKPEGIIFVRGGESSPKTHYGYVQSYLTDNNPKNIEAIHF